MFIPADCIRVFAFVFSSCEKKQVADLTNLTLSFEYREVVNDKYDNNKVEIRSTSTPSFVAPDIWYDWGYDSGIAIPIFKGI